MQRCCVLSAPTGKVTPHPTVTKLWMTAARRTPSPRPSLAKDFGGVVDIVLGVSMAPKVVRMVLVEGENADGVTVDSDEFPVAFANGSTTTARAQVIAAILGTRESAAEGGYRLMSTGVTWTEPIDVGVLQDELAARQIGGVMLVSPLLAAAALTQTVGQAMGYEYTALLFIEPDSATLAVVHTADGSIVDLHRQHADWAGRTAVEIGKLAAMVG